MISLVKKKAVAIGNTVAISLMGIQFILPGMLDLIVGMVAIGVLNLVIKINGVNNN